ncbi:rifin PIR protein, putative [Plasmodium reichenowi]|uniref:Rifin PIR protein, putative n=1 Tax=Plasmodium reichenowi TaxID=5854 RepID=A0A2P9D4C9_PLARE|nr:rifin PIR protein, putative [Plasmodium reichenowi]
MNVHYINTLLFALPLNILAHNQRNHKSTTHHTPKIQTTRILCELYAPANYDNDPQMKEIVENFNKQTQERFHEYDDRMIEKRKQCKEKCDKEIQKIILKDKLEKELMDKFATLDTDIQSDAIPTCVCEKSVADKMEKGCLRCAGVLGGGVMPAFGTIGGTALYALSQLKPYALFTAAKYAMFKGAAKGIAAGKSAGMDVVIGVLKDRGIAEYCPQIFEQIQKIEKFFELKNFAGAIIKRHGEICSMTTSGDNPLCIPFEIKLGTRLPDKSYSTPVRQLVPKMLDRVVYKAEQAAATKTTEVSSTTYTNIMTKQTALIEGGFNSTTTSIYVSIIAIVVIVLIMIIIYLILRRRRKKKMKKKLQYIKLLEE